jgi:polysaccharide biosynthesis transport protein
LRAAQFSLKEMRAMLRRRRYYLLVPAGIVTVLSIIGAFVLPTRYESSTSILVQRDEILNPLISYEMAVAIASEDRLRTFNEIIYSQPTIQKLIDSLYPGSRHNTEEQRQELTKTIKKNIAIDRRGSDSFRITYTETDPILAQRAAELLSNIFIETTLGIEGKRNDNTVQFFENKLEEIRRKFEVSQKQVVSRLKQSIDVTPAASRALYAQVEDIEKRQSELEARSTNYQHELVILRSFPEALQSDTGRQALFDLQRADIPFAGDLRPLVIKYDDLMRRYTDKYPEVRVLEKQITELLDRMYKALQSEIAKQEPMRMDLEAKHALLVEQIKQSSISEHVNEDNESDYGIYRKLYDEMKVKLEQAKTTRDLGTKSANQFIILDPALVPSQPSKPNRPLIVAGGFGLGIFLGFISMIFKETFDTTVRVPSDIVVYQKPIIAFITEGDDIRRN